MKLAVQKISSADATATLFEDMQRLLDEINQRAFSLFQQRGSHGRALDDWLQAEQQLICRTQSELIDRGGDYQLRIAVPGVDAKDLQVSALPDSIVVRADLLHEHDEQAGNVLYCEFAAGKLCRRIELPETIDVDKVSATLDRGILQVVAEKAEARLERKVAVTA